MEAECLSRLRCSDFSSPLMLTFVPLNFSGHVMTDFQSTICEIHTVAKERSRLPLWASINDAIEINLQCLAMANTSFAYQAGEMFWKQRLSWTKSESEALTIITKLYIQRQKD